MSEEQGCLSGNHYYKTAEWTDTPEKNGYKRRITKLYCVNCGQFKDIEWENGPHYIGETL